MSSCLFITKYIELKYGRVCTQRVTLSTQGWVASRPTYLAGVFDAPRHPGRGHVKTRGINSDYFHVKVSTYSTCLHSKFIKFIMIIHFYESYKMENGRSAKKRKLNPTFPNLNINITPGLIRESLRDLSRDVLIFIMTSTDKITFNDVYKKWPSRVASLSTVLLVLEGVGLVLEDKESLTVNEIACDSLFPHVTWCTTSWDESTEDRDYIDVTSTESHEDPIDI